MASTGTPVRNGSRPVADGWNVRTLPGGGRYPIVTTSRNLIISALTMLGLLACAAPAHAAVDWWHPAKGLSWQWQLSGTLDPTVNAQVYDVDAVDTSAAQVAALHAAGRKVICYVDAGSWEAYRPDASRYPSVVLGKTM